jgi:hypothetical protein
MQQERLLYGSSEIVGASAGALVLLHPASDSSMAHNMPQQTKLRTADELADCIAVTVTDCLVLQVQRLQPRSCGRV